jgi:hypothetical protein
VVPSASVRPKMTMPVRESLFYVESFIGKRQYLW